MSVIGLRKTKTNYTPINVSLEYLINTNMEQILLDYGFTVAVVEQGEEFQTTLCFVGIYDDEVGEVQFIIQEFLGEYVVRNNIDDKEEFDSVIEETTTNGFNVVSTANSTVDQWLLANTVGLNQFRRLYLGDVVKSFGTRQLRKLTTEKPQEDSIIGTWVFNDSLDFSSFSENWYADFNFTNGSTVYPYCGYNHFGENSEYNKLVYYNADGSGITVYKLGSGWVAQAYKTITIETETEDTFFISWLKANATKQESIVGTWVFKDTLTAVEGIDYVQDTEIIDIETVECELNGNPLIFTGIVIPATYDNSNNVSLKAIDISEGENYPRDFVIYQNYWHSSLQNIKTFTITKDTETKYGDWLRANTIKIA